MTQQTVNKNSTSSSGIAEALAQTGFMNRTNLVYGAVGALVLMQAASVASWKSFVAGWLIAVLNLELLRRLAGMLVATYDGSKLGGLFYFVLFGKFAFWGLVVALFLSAKWIQALPFVAGMSTILIGAAAVGLREMSYAR